ncbi:uracil-DNA glycosylase family protein [Acuticoccus sp. MNP-M23]|uniref:uracil-DNA glycosylase family protein n=1 Tax=Acuticoccus sp. MNP-M23 TaxID=3072793 RepID=UPI0028165FBC|nr:uracil-DNA glycosylase family protein [Acuticoccus sp. MNP-M23]WMS42060.1 uracil-DNA glycosylase family protein [Acuticoccus sp. MNP-M23]
MTRDGVPADGAPLEAFLGAMSRCRICRDTPTGEPLPHEPRPIFQISSTARIAICSQAPGNKAHVAGLPFYDPSGVRLRDWMGLDETQFYDWSKIAIIPMGFCFPGYDRHGGDLPPRRECGATWHDRLFQRLPQLSLFLCIGKYSLSYHLPHTRRASLTDTVGAWRDIVTQTAPRTVMALPHPSWRNNVWLKRNPWFEAEVLPELRRRVADALSATDST